MAALGALGCARRGDAAGDSASALPDDRASCARLVLASPLGFIAIEAGWTVTEVGRQPWIMQGVMRTADAVTPMPGLIVPFLLFSLLYIGLGITVVFLLWRRFSRPVCVERPAGTDR